MTTRKIFCIKYNSRIPKSNLTCFPLSDKKLPKYNGNRKMAVDNRNPSKISSSIAVTLEDFCRPSTLNFCIRGLCLFVLGMSFSCVLNVMLILPELRRKVVYERDLLDKLYATTWWFAPSGGLASALIGLIYPCMDSRLGERHNLRTEWPSVLRCAALFIGITHAVVVFILIAYAMVSTTSWFFAGIVGILNPTAKYFILLPYFGLQYYRMRLGAVFPVLHLIVYMWIFLYFKQQKLRFQSDVHLFITIAAFSVLLWWYFDRSKNGFGLGLLIAISAAVFLRFVGPHGIYSEKMSLNQLWVPCWFFSGGVTMGKIGRQLAMIEYVPRKVKYHAD